MKNPRFFLENIELIDNKIEIDNESVIHQIRNVLRLKDGDKITLFNKNGEQFFGKLDSVMKKKIIFSKEIMKKKSKSSKVRFVLYPAIIKKDKLEYVLQKGTEIGVDEFRLTISNRTEKLGLNLERARKIIKEAAEQSQKNFLPPVYEPQSISELMTEYETRKEGTHSEEIKKDIRCYLDINADLLDTIQIRQDILGGLVEEIHFYVGPEGGWDEKDKKEFKKAGVKPASLGKGILRAETASIAVASIILLPQLF